MSLFLRSPLAAPLGNLLTYGCSPAKSICRYHVAMDLLRVKSRCLPRARTRSGTLRQQNEFDPVYMNMRIGCRIPIWNQSYPEITVRFTWSIKPTGDIKTQERPNTHFI